jgi:hypothetical protein
MEAMITLNSDDLRFEDMTEFGTVIGGTRYLDVSPATLGLDDISVFCLELIERQRLLLRESRRRAGCYERIGVYAMSPYVTTTNRHLAHIGGENQGIR